MRTRHAGIVMVLSLAAGAPVRAGGDAPAETTHGHADLLNLNLEQLMQVPVRAASGFAQQTGEAPSSVTILTRADFQAFGYRTLADALASVAGFYPNYDRTYQNIGVRGFSRLGDYNNRILVLINGVRVNDPLYNTGAIGNEFALDVDLIERVEIVRGPSSSLYGSSAFFAVVNVITREARDVAPVETAVSAGTHDAYRYRFSVGDTWGTQGSLLVSGTLLRREGGDLYFPAYDALETHHGVAEGLDGERLGNLFVLGRYGNWAWQATHVDRTKERPTAAFGTRFDDPEAEDRDRETLLDLAWSGPLADDWEGLFRAGWLRYAYDGTYPYDEAQDDAPPSRRLDRERGRAESVRGEARVSTTLQPHHSLAVGTAVRHAYRIELGYRADGETLLDRQTHATDLGVYLLDEWRATERVLVNAGLRYDRQEPYGDEAVSPRAALILKPFRPSVCKLIYGQAFRAPSAYERFYDDGGVTTKANPDLQPETIRTYEAVWEQKVTPRLQLNASVYRYRATDLITQTTDPADGLFVLRNVDEAEANGGELGLAADWPGDVQTRANYGYCDATDGRTGKRLNNSPEHMVKLNVLAPAIPRWVTAGLEVQYCSRRLTALGTEAEGYTLINLTLLSRSLARNLDVSFSVYNLFDKAYAQPVADSIASGLVEQDGRTFRAKVAYRF
jgi:outer membrane receptor protein involved in Fe transport